MFGIGESSRAGSSSRDSKDDVVRKHAEDLDRRFRELPGRLRQQLDAKLEPHPRSRAAVQNALDSSEQWSDRIVSSPPLLVLSTLTAAAASYTVYRRCFRRLPTAAHFTPSTLRWRRMLVGKCTSVGDADGFRLYHTPGPPLYRDIVYNSVPIQHNGNGTGNDKSAKNTTEKGKSKSTSNHSHNSHPHHTQTISVRLAGADAPELPHFGRPGQPFGEEARDELKRLVLGRTVWCQMSHIDQYQRLVATPYVWMAPYIFGRTNVSLHLVKNGLATVYTQSGAAYSTAGPWTRFMRWLLSDYRSSAQSEASSKTKASTLDPRTRLLDYLLPLSGEARMKRAMARAKRRRIGLWSQRRIETPEEYKRRARNSA